MRAAGGNDRAPTPNQRGPSLPLLSASLMPPLRWFLLSLSPSFHLFPTYAPPLHFGIFTTTIPSKPWVRRPQAVPSDCTNSRPRPWVSIVCLGLYIITTTSLLAAQNLKTYQYFGMSHGLGRLSRAPCLFAALHKPMLSRQYGLVRRLQRFGTSVAPASSSVPFSRFST